MLVIATRMAVAAGLMSLFLCLTAVGAGVATKQNNVAVSWYSGYTMPTLLAKPMQPAGNWDLSEISKQKWYSDETAEWRYRLELVAISDIDKNGKPDWVLWLSDESKSGNYRGYQTLIAYDVKQGNTISAKPYQHKQ